MPGSAAADSESGVAARESESRPVPPIVLASSAPRGDFRARTCRGRPGELESDHQARVEMAEKAAACGLADGGSKPAGPRLRETSRRPGPAPQSRSGESRRTSSETLPAAAAVKSRRSDPAH